MFCGHRADTQVVSTCMSTQGPRLRWPSTLVSQWTPVTGPDLPPAPTLAGICLGPCEQRREGGAVWALLGRHPDGGGAGGMERLTQSRQSRGPRPSLPW